MLLSQFFAANLVHQQKEEKEVIEKEKDNKACISNTLHKSETLLGWFDNKFAKK